jgi:hypothetical protein
LRKISQNFFSGGCHVTFPGAGDADGQRFCRAGKWAEEQAFASRDRNAQCDAVPGFDLNEDRAKGVAFHYDAWFDASGSENALEVLAIILRGPGTNNADVDGSSNSEH